MNSQISEWDEADRALGESIFGVRDRDAAFAMIEDWAQPRLGAAKISFFEMSIGAVAGLRLADRDLCLKIWPPRADRGELAAQIAVQAALARDGFPAPAVIGGLLPFGEGCAVLMAFNREGRATDVREPGVAAAMAAGLAALVQRAARFAALPGLPRHDLPAGLWPKPHNVLFDFAKTAQGAEWIDEIAASALARLRARRSAPAVGHFDWSAKNMRMGPRGAAVIYDWDAIRIGHETAIVGEAAANFPATWELPVRRIPAPAEMGAFVRAYESARGRAFSAGELEEIAASATYARAYGARCAHAIDPQRRDWAGSGREALSALGGGYTAEMLR